MNPEGEMEQDLKTMMLNLKDLELEEDCVKEFSFYSYVRAFHVYKDIWNPRILKCRHEKGNEHDEFAIGVYSNDEMKEEIVGHTPLYLSKAMFKLFQLSQLKICCTVTEKWMNIWMSIQALDLKFLLNINI